MAARSPRTSLLAIVGPTASGKSELAMKVARQFDGEIITADSRTVYKGMDIGTAKPSKADRAGVKHWGLDVVEPGQSFTAAMFKSYAEAAIEHIRSRGKLPIIVGGTGLYVDGLLYDFGFLPPAAKQRETLNMLRVAELQAMISKAGYAMPENRQNKRHLIRTIERDGQTGAKKSQLPAGVLLVGLLPPDNKLRDRIDHRAAAIFQAGVVEETQKLVKKYGRDKLLQTAGIVYKICLDLLDQKIDQVRAIELFKTADWQYARRQKTWFKRSSHIKWFDNPQSGYEFIRGHLDSRTN